MHDVIIIMAVDTEVDREYTWHAQQDRQQKLMIELSQGKTNMKHIKNVNTRPEVC